MKHLCDSCMKDFPTCDSGKIIWGIDINPAAVGKEADVVVKCAGYVQKKEIPLELENR